MSIDIVDGWAFLIGASLSLIRTIEIYCSRYDHAIYIYFWSEYLLVFICRLGIIHTTLGTTAISHQSSYLFSFTHDDNTTVGDFGILFCRNIGPDVSVASADAWKVTFSSPTDMLMSSFSCILIDMNTSR